MPTLFIRVCAFSKNSVPLLVAVAKNGTLPLADATRLIPNIVGLTFCNSEGYLQGLACDGDSIQPPHHGWLFNENYYAIVGPGNTPVHQENILPTMTGHSTKVEPVKHNGVQIPFVPSTVDEQQKNNSVPGLNSIALLTGPPACISSAGVEGHGNGGAVIPLNGVFPLVSEPSLVSKPKKITKPGCDLCGVSYNTFKDRDQHLTGKRHRDRKIIEDEAQRQNALYGHTVNINTEMHVTSKTAEDDNDADADSAADEGGDADDADDAVEDDDEDDDSADDADDDAADDELKGNGTHMLGFSGFPKRNAHDLELKKYLTQFGELLHCKIRRKHRGKGLSTGVADVLFKDLSAQESALQAQHVFRAQQCTLTREAFLNEKERLRQRDLRGPRDATKDKVVRITQLQKGTKTEDVEKLLAGYAGVKEIFVNKRGCNAYVDFETPFYALQLVKNKPIQPGRKLRVQFAKPMRGWRPGNASGGKP